MQRDGGLRLRLTPPKWLHLSPTPAPRWGFAMNNLELKDHRISSLFALIESQPGDYRHVFRGQANAQWGLVPTLYRNTINVGAEPSRQTMMFSRRGALKGSSMKDCRICRQFKDHTPTTGSWHSTLECLRDCWIGAVIL